MAKVEWWQLERGDFTLDEGSRPSERSEAAVRQALIAGVGGLAVALFIYFYEHAHGAKAGVFVPTFILVWFSFIGRGFDLLGIDLKQTPAGTDDPEILRRRLRHRRNAGAIQIAFAFVISLLDGKMGLFLTGSVALVGLLFLYRVLQIDRRIAKLAIH